MLLHDAHAHPQTQARSRRALRSKKRLKQFWRYVFRNPQTAVHNLHHHPSPVQFLRPGLLHTNANPPPRPRRINRIPNQVREHLPQLRRKTLDDRRPRQMRLQLNALMLHAPVQQQ